MSEPEIEAGWHLDKKVPISIIFVLLAQFVGGVWYVGRVEARVAMLEHTEVLQGQRDERQDRTNADALMLVRQQLDKIDSKLDRALEVRPVVIAR